LVVDGLAVGGFLDCQLVGFRFLGLRLSVGSPKLNVGISNRKPLKPTTNNQQARHMDFPDDLRYTENHEWIGLAEDGETATIGITAFAQHELGDIVFVELEPEGTKLDQEDVFGTVEAVKTVNDLYMPAGGEIVALNDGLETNPETVNDDPYGDGWMIRVKLRDPSELDDLQEADEYGEMVA
jgi:glycine cleavage system H protein